MRNAPLLNKDETFTLKQCPQSLDGSLKKRECGEAYTEEELVGFASLYPSIGDTQYN